MTTIAVALSTRRMVLSCLALAVILLAGPAVENLSAGPVEVQDWSYPPKGLGVFPSAGGGMFVQGQPIAFRVRWKPKDKAAPRAVEIAAQVQHFYGRSPVKGAALSATLDEQGKGRLAGTFDLPRGPYRLALTVSHDGKTLATGGLDFAIAGPTPPAPKDIDAEWLATCTQFQWHPGRGHFGRQLAALERIGFRWVRFNNYLDVAGQEFHQKKIKHIIDQLARRDIEFFQLVLSTPKAMQDPPESGKDMFHRWPPKSFDEWQAALKRTMEGYGPKSHRYEIWNEPAGHFLYLDGMEDRFPGGKDQIIYDGLRRAVDVAKQMDFPVTIAGPGSVPWAYNVPQRILAEHGGFWNVLTIHYREESLQIGGSIQFAKRLVDRYSDGTMDIWLTEAQSSSGLYGEDRMAAELKKYTRMWMERLADKLFHFDFSHPMGGGNPRSMLLNYTTLTVSPGAVTFQQMLSATRDGLAVGPLLFDTPNREGYLFMKNAKPCAIVWGNQYDETAPIPAYLIGPETSARDMYGNVLPVDQPTKLYRPIYLENIRTDAKIVQDALVRLQPFVFRIDQGSKNYLRLGLANPSAEPKTYRVTFPAGPISVSPAEVNLTLEPGQAKSVPLTLTGGKIDQPGPIEWIGQVNGQPQLLARLYLHDPETFQTLTINPTQGDWKPLPPFQKPFNLADPDNLDNADPVAIVEHKENRQFGQPVSTEWIGPFDPKWRGLPDNTPQMQTCKITDDGLLCWTDWPESKGATLDASFGPARRIPLPGMVTEALVTVEVTPEMIHDGHLRVLIGLRDADGVLFRYLASKELIAKPGPQTLRLPLSSPLRMVHRDSSHGGGKFFLQMKYPVTFEGVGLGMTNNRHLPEGRFRFGAIIKDIRFRYVDRPDDIKQSNDLLVPFTGPMEGK